MSIEINHRFGGCGVSFDDPDDLDDPDGHFFELMTPTA
jgi:hypothetical protein